MVNTLLLDKTIEESGLKKGHIANELGISVQSLRMKSKNVYPFTSDEVIGLCNLLNIKRISDKERIFFAKNVDKTST